MGKNWTYRTTQGPAELTLERTLIPRPGRGQVRMRVCSPISVTS